ncbi:M48 family metallopeptidase [Ramlibacter sp. H39-3-26]|uniref:M48 family metallopeptidase n=1 Tax=Curvibacter soli TaxID=3031331 RepID=UPI0023DABCA0|nr:M48 family metallopeptidase [Ramlibacter sp. H39-3-26]MDF1483617.1 M48 family metallopeptidase [Ramlibacter sp. H39-3-26]
MRSTALQEQQKHDLRKTGSGETFCLWAQRLCILVCIGPEITQKTRRLRTLAATAALACAGLAAMPASAQLGGLLNSLRGGGDGSAPANILSSVLGGGGNSGGAQPDELIQMLSQSVTQIDEAREIQIGRQLAAVLLGSKPLHPDMALQRYVNQLGRWISLQSLRPTLPWTFVVLDDPGFNAFAAPGGYVFVTKGLVDSTKDESELAGILAHEITHVTAKHHLQAMRKSAQTGLLTQLAASQLKNNLGGAVSAQLLTLGRNLYSRGLDQSDEFEADRNGVALATRAGFDPYGLVAVLQQLRTATPDNPMFTLTLSTHPPAQARLDQLEQAMGQRLDPYTGKPAVTVAQRLAARK